mgnify:CR=1 FL=1
MEGVKFTSKFSEEIFRREFEVSGIEDINEFLFQRRKLELGLVDKERSRLQKQNWRRYRWKYLKGIRRFHKSTAGKRFHKQLGRWLATRPFDKIVYQWEQERKALDREREVERLKDILTLREFLIAGTSAITHALIEKRYVGLLEEEIEYDLFLEYFWDRYLDTLRSVDEGRLDLVDWDWWVGVVEPSVWSGVFKGLKVDEGFYEDFSEVGDYLRWLVQMQKIREVKTEEEEVEGSGD